MEKNEVRQAGQKQEENKTHRRASEEDSQIRVEISLTVMASPSSSLRVEQDMSSFSSAVSSTPSVNDFNNKSPNKVKKRKKQRVKTQYKRKK